jgi:Domain of unknown function (DUF4357)
MKGRTVRLYLVDGIPSGVLTAEIMNWTGRVTVAPRTQLADLASRDEVKRTGIYILAGDNPDNPTQELIYIGESDNVWKRLIQHSRDVDKDFWTRTVIITSKDENLTKSHVRYLESRLIQTSVQAQRAKLANGTNPDTTSLPEPDVADMEYFLDQIQMLLPVLGLSFAVPLPVLPPPVELPIEKSQDAKETYIESPTFQMSYAGVNAYAQEINGEFVVYKSSTARKINTQSLANSFVQMRTQLYRDGKLADTGDNDYWVFTQNVPFSSPSTAANIVGGAQLNGRTTWKVKDSDKTYAEWQESQIKQAELLAPDDI